MSPSPSPKAKPDNPIPYTRGNELECVVDATTLEIRLRIFIYYSITYYSRSSDSLVIV